MSIILINPTTQTKNMLALRSLLVLLLFTTSITTQAENAWPEKVVTIEEMKPLTPVSISIPTDRAKGEVRGPSVLRLHVDATGQVRRVALHESCGSPAHDEAAMYAIRSMRFAPKVIDGAPADVTLLVPLHLPKPKSPFGQ